MPDQNNPTDTNLNPPQVTPLVSDFSPPPPMDIPTGDASLTPPSDSGAGSAAPTFDIPPVVTPAPKPKGRFGGKKVIATILGLLILVGGLGAGVILVRQQQDIREKAVALLDCVGEGGTCYPTNYVCSDNITIGTNCPSGKKCSFGKCTAPTPAPAPTPTFCLKDCVSPQSECKSGTQVGGVGYGDCGAGEYCCEKAPPPPPPSNFCLKDCVSSQSQCTTGSQVGGVGYGDCGAGEYCCDKSAPPPTPPPPQSTLCTLTASELCVGNNPVGECYQGGNGKAYACYKLQGNPGKKISGSTNCDCPAPYTWGPRQEYGSWWCFNTAITNCTPGVVDGRDTSERCSLLPQQCVPTSTPPPPPPPTPTPPPPPTPSPSPGSTPPPPTPTPPPTAQCLNIQAFDTSWNKLSSTDLSNLKPGDKVRFTVAGQASSGKFDKARFKVNSVQRPEVTQKRPGTDEFYDEYTIPGGTTTFSINAQIHHEILGWSN